MKNMKETTNTKNRAAVPYIAFESAQARAERTTKRLFAALLASLTLNAGLLVWLYTRGGVPRESNSPRKSA